MSKQRYVHAAGFAAFTRLYDPLMALTMREKRWRAALVREVSAKLPAGGTVVDVGAGTGSFAIAFADARRDARVIAVDGDPDVLTLARGKKGADLVDWREGLAGELPLDADEADVMVMSLLLHHLRPDAKRPALADGHRVLHAGGWLHLADWGRPRGLVPRVGFLAVRLLDGFDGTRDHAQGRLPSLIAAAGFGPVRVWDRLPTVWGTLELLSARRSTEPAG